MLDVVNAVPSTRTEVCARACEHCAVLCERVARSDPSYTHSADPFSGWQLALISLASICQLTSAALLEARGDFREMCAWCRDTCEQLEEISLPPTCDARSLWFAVRTCRELCAMVSTKPCA